MSLLESLERKALFRLTRLLALLMIFVLAVGLVLGAFEFATNLISSTSSSVTIGDVSRELHPDLSTSAEAPKNPQQSSAEESGVSIPFVIQPYFSTSANRTVLFRHLAGLDSGDRSDYLDNLASVVTESKRTNLDTMEVINKFFELKDSQLAVARLDRAERTKQREYAAAFVFSGLFLVALASLILVLLAIERNTRRALGV